MAKHGNFWHYCPLGLGIAVSQNDIDTFTAHGTSINPKVPVPWDRP
jgi:hypothetical protein